MIQWIQRWLKKFAAIFAVFGALLILAYVMTPMVKGLELWKTCPYFLGLGLSGWAISAVLYALFIIVAIVGSKEF